MIDLSHLTPEQVFQNVCDGFEKQNWECAHVISNHGRKCVYRSPDGKKCAAGQLIPDDQYIPEMDQSAGGYTWRAFVNKGWVTSAHVDLITSLQTAHDTASARSGSSTVLATELAEVGRAHGLRIPPSLTKALNA